MSTTIHELPDNMSLRISLLAQQYKNVTVVYGDAHAQMACSSPPFLLVNKRLGTVGQQLSIRLLPVQSWLKTSEAEEHSDCCAP